LDNHFTEGMELRLRRKEDVVNFKIELELRSWKRNEIYRATMSHPSLPPPLEGASEQGSKELRMFGNQQNEVNEMIDSRVTRDNTRTVFNNSAHPL
jgi:hypothetical protein